MTGDDTAWIRKISLSLIFIDFEIFDESSYYGSQIPGINMTNLYGNMLNEFDHEDFMERTHSTGKFFH